MLAANCLLCSLPYEITMWDCGSTASDVGDGNGDNPCGSLGGTGKMPAVSRLEGRAGGPSVEAKSESQATNRQDIGLRTVAADVLAQSKGCPLLRFMCLAVPGCGWPASALLRTHSHFKHSALLGNRGGSCKHLSCREMPVGALQLHQSDAAVAPVKACCSARGKRCKLSLPLPPARSLARQLDQKLQIAD